MSQSDDVNMKEVSLDSNDEAIDVQENDLTREDPNRKSRNSRKRQRRRERKLRLRDLGGGLDVIGSSSASPSSSGHSSPSGGPSPNPKKMLTSSDQSPRRSSEPSNTNVMPSNTNDVLEYDRTHAAHPLFTPQLLQAIRDASPANLRPILSDPQAVTEALARLIQPQRAPECPREVHGKRCGDPFEVRQGVPQPYCPRHMKTRVHYERDLADKALRAEIDAQIMKRPEIAELANIGQQANNKKRKYMEAQSILKARKSALKEMKAINKEAKKVSSLDEEVSEMKEKIVDEQAEADKVCEHIAKKPRLFE